MEIDTETKCLIEGTIKKLEAVIDSDILQLCNFILPEGRNQEFYDGFFMGVTELGKVYNKLVIEVEKEETNSEHFKILMQLIACFSLLILKKENI